MIKKFLRGASCTMLALLLALLLIPQPVQAAGASLSGSSSIQAGNTVTLTLSVPNSIYGLTADLSYSSNLSFTNYNCSVSGWSILVNNNKFSAYGTSSASGGVIVIKLKVSGSAKEGDELSASFTSVTVSDGNSDTDLGTASWSGKVGAAPSGDCALSSLSCGNATLSPSFTSKTTYYSCTVPFAVTKLDLNYKKSDSGASVSVSGNDELAVGANTVTIKVTAANGETRTYTIEVTREQDPNYKPSTNGKLSALTIEGASLSPRFSAAVTDYIAYVPYETTSITLAAQAADELLTIRGIRASFVLYPKDQGVYISARSLGEVNVQVIVEALGGGGNSTTAGGQLNVPDIAVARTALLRAIDEYFEK